MVLWGMPVAAAGGAVALVLFAQALFRALRARRRPQVSLARITLLMLAMAVSLMGAVRWFNIDRYLALAEPWTRDVIAKSAAAKDGQAKAESFAEVPKDMELDVIRFAVTRLPQTAQRVAGLKLLVELHPSAALEKAVAWLSEQDDPEAAQWQIRLIALYRDPEALPLFRDCLKDPEPFVRAAAADALGILHKAVGTIPPEGAWPYSGMWLDSAPAISIDGLVKENWNKQAKSEGKKFIELPSRFYTQEKELPKQVRAELENTMLEGPSAEERTAAARALVRWPPEKYALRVAEWGVWIADAGDLKLVKSVLDEIPPFVHRTGNTIESLEERVNEIRHITKPILHLTVDRPLAVNVEVQITQGRPWFAYPKPDDFAMTMTYRTLVPNEVGKWVAVPGLEGLDRGGPPPLEDTAEGYPWILPNHRKYGATSGPIGSTIDAIFALGLCWQTLIVTPDRRDWMTPPDAGADARFRWWTRLREVPCGWVSGRGESERFLYYDGPTKARSPVMVRLDGDGLAFTMTKIFDKAEHESRKGRTDFTPLKTPTPEGGLVRRGIYLEVTGDAVSARMFEIPDKDDRIAFNTLPEKKGNEAEASFLKLLTSAGLTDAEAKGLLDAWRPQFFGTKGKRFVLLLRADEYDAMCPLQVRPKPTELARVGLVLTEF